MYVKIKNQNVQPHVKIRFILLGVSSLMFMVVGCLVIFAHTATSMEIALLGEILIIIIGSILSVFSLFIWIMSDFVKKLLDRGFKS